MGKPICDSFFTAPVPGRRYEYYRNEFQAACRAGFLRRSGIKASVREVSPPIVALFGHPKPDKYSADPAIIALANYAVSIAPGGVFNPPPMPAPAATRPRATTSKTSRKKRKVTSKLVSC